MVRHNFMWYVYMLKSFKKRWYYVGSTNRLNIRVEEHNKKRVASTKNYVPLKLVYIKKFDNEREASAYEKKVKYKRIEKETIIKKIECQ